MRARDSFSDVYAHVARETRAVPGSRNPYPAACTINPWTPSSGRDRMQTQARPKEPAHDSNLFVYRGQIRIRCRTSRPAPFDCRLRTLSVLLDRKGGSDGGTFPWRQPHSCSSNRKSRCIVIFKGARERVLFYLDREKGGEFRSDGSIRFPVGIVACY